MKKYLTYAILLAMFTTGASLKAQPNQDEYLGLPGDNLNLYAVMKLFQESPTLETFERDLNDQNFRINNLDLNGDNMIDYITVRDYTDKNVHTIVLQDAINNRETQDVAVFTVQSFNNGQVQIQLIGDEALYGRNYIIEPITDEQYAGQTPNPGYAGNPGYNGTVVTTTYSSIAAWPIIRFIYSPGYVVWHSSWHWGYYPSYWRPWRPFYWDYYYGYHYNMYHDYYSHYRHWNSPRYTHWNDYYYSQRRSSSPYVSKSIKSGHYKATYSHPEQRSKGEDLYTRTSHEQVNRRAEPAQVNTTSRRNDNSTGIKSQPKGNTSRTDKRTSPTQSKSTVNPVTKGSGNNTRRSAEITGGSPAGKSAKPAAKTTTTSSGRSTKASNPAAKTTTTSSSRSTKASNPAGKTTTTSSRRSAKASKPAKTTKSSETKKSAETTKPNRRK